MDDFDPSEHTVKKEDATTMNIPTPSFVIDEAAIGRNMDVLSVVKERAGCRVLLALKAFSAFSVFPLMRRALDGCCASSVDEARLGWEKFGVRSAEC